jgi:hypothetical protein
LVEGAATKPFNEIKHFRDKTALQEVVKATMSKLSSSYKMHYVFPCSFATAKRAKALLFFT